MGILNAIKKLSLGSDEEKQDHQKWLSNVHVNIDIQSPREFYSSGDVVQGLVHLELDELVEIGDVEVVYNVVASTQIYLNDTSSSSESEISSDAPSSQDESELSLRKLEKKYDKKQKKLRRRRVKQHLRDEASNKKFAKLSRRHEQRRNNGRKSNTMTSQSVEHEQVIKLRGGSPDEPMMKPGTYSYPFKFQFPGHAGDAYRQGLTSFEVAYGMGKIEHTLRGKVFRKSQFGQLQQCDKLIGFKALSEPSPVAAATISRRDRAFFNVGSAFNRKIVECSASAALPDSVWNWEQFEISIKFQLTDGCQFSVASIVVDLAMETTIQAQSETEKLLDRIPLFEDLKKQNLDPDEVAAKLRNLCVPKDTVPNFTTKHLTLKYWLEASIEVYALKNHKDSKTLTFKVPVTVHARTADEKEKLAHIPVVSIPELEEKSELPPDYGEH